MTGESGTENLSAVTRELPSTGERMKDLLKLSEPEKEELRKSISNSKGTVQIWVHTHFTQNYWDPAATRYFERRRKLITKSMAAEMPVIAFIDSQPIFDPGQEKIKKYSEYYLPNHEITKPVYYVRTYANDPTPCLLEDEDDRLGNKKNNWDQLAGVFNGLGINRVIVSGVNLRFQQISALYKPHRSSEEQQFLDEDKKFGENNLPEDCVGGTVVQLQTRGIKVFLSNVTYPEVKPKSPPLSPPGSDRSPEPHPE